MKLKGTIGNFRLESVGKSKSSFFARERQSGRRFLVLSIEPETDLSDPDHRRWYRQMQNVLRRFEHPNVVVPKLLMREGKYYIIREFIEGTPLNEAKDLDPGQILKFMSSVADGVAAARRSGVAHGEIKPNKIILTTDQHPKLVGLGEREIINVLRGKGRLFDGELAPKDDIFVNQVETGDIASLLHRIETRVSTPIKPAENAKTTDSNLVRFVNTWFDVDELPIQVKRPCSFNFNIGPRSEHTAEDAARFKEPDYGDQTFVTLMVTLFSDDFGLEKDWFQFNLQKTGGTETFTTRVTALRAGAECSIRLHICLAREKQLLQVLMVTVRVTEGDHAQSLVLSGAD